MWNIEEEPIRSAAIYWVMFLCQSLTGHRGCIPISVNEPIRLPPCGFHSVEETDRQKMCQLYRFLEGGRCLTEIKDGERKGREDAVFIRIENKTVSLGIKTALFVLVLDRHIILKELGFDYRHVEVPRLKLPYVDIL